MASGQTLFRVGPRAAMPTATAAAIPAAVIGASSPAEQLDVLVFDYFSDTFADFSLFMPGHYSGGGLTLEIEFGMESDTDDDHFIQLEAAIRRLDTAEVFSSSHTYDYNVYRDNIPDNTGKRKKAVITFTNGPDMDNWVAGESAILRIKRETSDEFDDAILGLRLYSIHGKET